MDALYKTARDARETTVVVYNPTTKGIGPVIEGFEARFPGIRIKGVDLFGAQLLARVDSEFEAGGPLGDVVASTPADTPVIGEAGRLEAFLPGTARNLPKNRVGTDSQWLDWGLTTGHSITPQRCRRRRR